jgi:hypothetical protein
MEFENNTSSECDPAYEKKIGIIICTGISVIALVLVILVVALPSIYKKNNEKAEKAALNRLESLSSNMDEKMAVPSSVVDSTKKVTLLEADADDIHAKASEHSIERKVVLGSYSQPSLFYTIQAGSFNDMDSAWKLYDSILTKLNEKDLDYLRIEKVGEYYAVRIGKFWEQRHAKTFHDNIKSQLSTSKMMKAYIKKERLKMLHSS